MSRNEPSQMRSPRIGDVYTVDLVGAGSVQSGLRPCVVFQNNIGNAHSPNVVVIPMTSNLKKREMPTHVIIRASDTGLSRDSMALCENPQCIPKAWLIRYISTLPAYYMRQIAAASIMASGAIAYLDAESVIDLWNRASNVNAIP